VKHFASPDFWQCYGLLPQAIQELAKKNFEILKSHPENPNLRLKKVGIYWSARVGAHYRVLGKIRSEGIVWFWIGHHAEYSKILK
jgi:mRNA-degrading endonuclease RelE of RelBE toxin-antitoxin system